MASTLLTKLFKYHPKHSVKTKYASKKINNNLNIGEIFLRDYFMCRFKDMALLPRRIYELRTHDFISLSQIIKHYYRLKPEYSIKP